jgi:hypothetical protein
MMMLYHFFINTFFLFFKFLLSYVHFTFYLCTVQYSNLTTVLIFEYVVYVRTFYTLYSTYTVHCTVPGTVYVLCTVLCTR